MSKIPIIVHEPGETDPFSNAFTKLGNAIRADTARLIELHEIAYHPDSGPGRRARARIDANSGFEEVTE